MLEENLAIVLMQQSNLGSPSTIILSDYDRWLGGLHPNQLWGLFVWWGEYNSTFSTLGIPSQRYQIEGWMIDRLFEDPDKDWWLFRKFLVDTGEHCNGPFFDEPVTDLLKKTIFIRNQLLGAAVEFAEDLMGSMNSTEMTNERLRSVIAIVLEEWLDWYNGNLTDLEALTDEESVTFKTISGIADRVAEVLTPVEDHDPDEELE